MLGGVYRIINLINSKIYIGSSLDIERRLKVHRGQLKNKEHFNKHLQNSWNLYGEENFSFEVLEIIEEKEKLIEREQEYINISKCSDIEYGYNVRKVADSGLGWKHIEETKKKISQTIKAQGAWNKGKKNSQKYINNMSLRCGGRYFYVYERDTKKLIWEGLSTEQCSRELGIDSGGISRCLKDKCSYYKNYSFTYVEDKFPEKKRIHGTKEYKNNMSVSKGGKSFLVYDKKTKELIGRWINQGECSRYLDIERQDVNACLKSSRRKTSKGFIFKWENE